MAPRLPPHRPLPPDPPRLQAGEVEQEAAWSIFEPVRAPSEDELAVPVYELLGISSVPVRRGAGCGSSWVAGKVTSPSLPPASQHLTHPAPPPPPSSSASPSNAPPRTPASSAPLLLAPPLHTLRPLPLPPAGLPLRGGAAAHRVPISAAWPPRSPLTPAPLPCGPPTAPAGQCQRRRVPGRGLLKAGAASRPGRDHVGSPPNVRAGAHPTAAGRVLRPRAFRTIIPSFLSNTNCSLNCVSYPSTWLFYF